MVTDEFQGHSPGSSTLASPAVFADVVAAIGVVSDDQPLHNPPGQFFSVLLPRLEFEIPRITVKLFSGPLAPQGWISRLQKLIRLCFPPRLGRTILRRVAYICLSHCVTINSQVAVWRKHDRPRHVRAGGDSHHCQMLRPSLWSKTSRSSSQRHATGRSGTASWFSFTSRWLSLVRCRTQADNPRRYS